VATCTKGDGKLSSQFDDRSVNPLQAGELIDRLYREKTL